jgi:hypothetical protein
MSTPRGYSSYRGRKPAGKIILTIVLVLVILAAVGFLLMQKYIVYDDTGTPHLQLPEEQAAASSASGASPEDKLNITIDQSHPKPDHLLAYQIAQTPLTDWQTASERLTTEAPDANAVVLTVKDGSGAVYYDSAAAAAVGAVRASGGTAAAISAMTASGKETIARLSCFRDSIAAKADVEGMGLKNTGGYIFYDGNNEQWLDPAKPAARQYLCALAKECAELGFHEILLTDFSYPTEGKLNKIDYGQTLKNENLTTFLTELKSALQGYDVKLSVELPAEVITSGGDAAAGLTLTDIASRVDRIYAQAAGADVDALSSAVTAVNADADFVPEVSAPLSGQADCLVTVGS